MTGAIGSYAFKFFLPIFLQQDLKFSEELSFILLASPILFAVIEVFAISWLADRYQVRSPFWVFQGLVAIIGLAITDGSCTKARLIASMNERILTKTTDISEPFLVKPV